jgi:hypothetical protein
VFAVSYGLIIARYDLWGLALGWIPAGIAAFIVGYIFRRFWVLGYIVSGMLLVLGVLLDGLV